MTKKKGKKKSLSVDQRLKLAATLRNDPYVKEHSTKQELHSIIIQSLKRWFMENESRYFDRLEKVFLNWDVAKEDFYKIINDHLIAHIIYSFTGSPGKKQESSI